MGNGCIVAHYCLFSTILLTATHWNIIKHELIFNVHEGKGLEHNHSLRFEIWLLNYCINLFGLTFTRVFQSWFGHQTHMNSTLSTRKTFPFFSHSWYWYLQFNSFFKAKNSNSFLTQRIYVVIFLIENPHLYKNKKNYK